MNKEITPLEALNKISEELDKRLNAPIFVRFTLEYKTIEKSLKALEIIKEKAKDQLHYLVISRNYDEYLRYCDDNNIPLQVRYSLEEYDLLKEVLK